MPDRTQVEAEELMGRGVPGIKFNRPFKFLFRCGEMAVEKILFSWDGAATYVRGNVPKVVATSKAPSSETRSLPASPMRPSYFHTDVRWNKETEWFCATCGRTPGHTTKEDALTVLRSSREPWKKHLVLTLTSRNS